MKRLLTKSRFKLAHECPTKLFYTGKPEYSNSNERDEFLKALAEGGIQVGELAKLYYPGGVELTERDYDKSHSLTQSHIEGDVPAIYEGAILHKNLYIRCDVIRRTGPKKFDLIEVKAKSYDPEEDATFWKSRPKVKGQRELYASWEPYLYDIAFQTHVARLAYPGYEITPYLLLANKKAKATCDGLNQLFLIRKDEAGRSTVVVREGTEPGDLGDRILIQVDVSEFVDYIIDESRNGAEDQSFSDYVESLAKLYELDHRYTPDPGSKCKKCEFSVERGEASVTARCGFTECWQEAFKVDADVLENPLVTELWRFLGADKALHSGIYLLKDLPASVINLKESQGGGLSSSERQLMQLEKVKTDDDTLYVDRPGLRHAISTWQYPLHFIDFETTTVAIPFYKGQRPYETVAFQFSHHQMESDGSYAHKNEFLFADPGKFPNFEFVRNLRDAVGTTGTIFRYSPHENTTLNQIRRQLVESSETDRKELIQFIDSVTREKTEDKKEILREGDRCMVDLFELLKKHYFDPRTYGSNSLKYVFPAILGRSEFLAKKYSKPIYGVVGGIPSKNFEDKVWIEPDSLGQVINPYRNLPPIIAGHTFEESERLFSNKEIREGGSASLAFARMQYEEMSETERAEIRSALLRYCELDTLAMVMMVEHWMNDLQ